MEDPSRLMRFVLEMRQAGVTDARVLSALERTPRAYFAPAHLEALALEDVALPLAHGQMMTKPSVVGRMLAALDPQAEDGVLEVGTGSGYQGGVIAHMARKLITLDRWRDLVADARRRFGSARIMHVFAHVADGAAGWAAAGPYDRIIVNAAVEEIPEPLIAQLKPSGTLVAPLGAGAAQRLTRLRFGAREDLGPIAFEPLVAGVPEDPRGAAPIAPAPDSEPEGGA
jgi:protein-L-isoaspartate(D-aspartate) O-methyltransferase